MQKQRTTFNPIIILGVWTVTMIILTPILIYTSHKGSVGGEQRPLTLLVIMPIITCLGALVIAIVIPFVFPQWFRTNRWFIFIIMVLLIPSIFIVWPKYTDDFSFRETDFESNGNNIKIKTEYYDLENNIIRSTAVWKNGKRDSIWRTFDKDGKIIKQEAYKNDAILKE